MKPKRWILVLCAFALLATTPLQASATGSIFFSGNHLVEWMRAHERCRAGKCNIVDQYKASSYSGYISGANDATFFMYNMPTGTTIGQCIVIVTKYLKAHPERWNYNAAILVTEALKEAFPKEDAK